MIGQIDNEPSMLGSLWSFMEPIYLDGLKSQGRSLFLSTFLSCMMLLNSQTLLLAEISALVLLTVVMECNYQDDGE